MGLLSILDRTRQNHAMEHATVAVLLEEGARGPLGGIATPRGFLIFGSLSTEAVTSSAYEGLRRLRGGESELAVSPYCGTNMVVGALLAALLSGIIMNRAKSRARGLPLAMAAIVGATLIKRPLGGAVQRHFTTLATVERSAITSVARTGLGGITVHWTRTEAGGSPVR